MKCLRPVLGVGGAAAALAALAISGSGVAAAATDVTGQKYSDAQSALSSAGLKPVVETVVGDQKAWPDCVVTRAQKRTLQPPENSSGSATDEMLVSPEMSPHEMSPDAVTASSLEASPTAMSPDPL